MHNHDDATKVVTIRISEPEYTKLQEIVNKNRNRWYPRFTTSSVIRMLIQYGLEHSKEAIK